MAVLGCDLSMIGCTYDRNVDLPTSPSPKRSIDTVGSLPISYEDILIEVRSLHSVKPMCRADELLQRIMKRQTIDSHRGCSCLRLGEIPRFLRGWLVLAKLLLSAVGSNFPARLRLPLKFVMYSESEFLPPSTIKG